MHATLLYTHSHIYQLQSVHKEYTYEGTPRTLLLCIQFALEPLSDVSTYYTPSLSLFFFYIIYAFHCLPLAKPFQMCIHL